MGFPIRAALVAGALSLAVGCGRLGFERGEDAGHDAAAGIDARTDLDAASDRDGASDDASADLDATIDVDASADLDAGPDAAVAGDSGTDAAGRDAGAMPTPCPADALMCEDFDGPTRPEWVVYRCLAIPVVRGAGRGGSAAFEVGPLDGDCSISVSVPVTPRGTELYVRFYTRWGPRGGTSELLWLWSGSRQATVVWTETSTGPATVRTYLQGGAYGSDVGMAASRAGSWTCVAATLRYADDGYLAVATYGGEVTRAIGTTRYADPGFDTVELGALNYARADSFAIDDIAIGTSPLPCD